MSTSARSRLRIRVSHEDKDRLAQLSHQLSLSLSDEVRLAVYLLTHVVPYQPARLFVFVNTANAARVIYEIDPLDEESERPLSRCFLELVRTPDLEDGLRLLQEHSFGNNQSEVVRRAASVLYDLQSYAHNGWTLCVAHKDTTDQERLEEFGLCYPPSFKPAVQRPKLTASETNSADVSPVGGIIERIIDQFGKSKLLLMATRWAHLRGQSVEDLFKDCLTIAEEQLAPEFFYGCATSEQIVRKLTTSEVYFRSIIFKIGSLTGFSSIAEGLAYQLCRGAKIFILHETMEQAEAMCETVLECAKEFTDADVNRNRLYSVSIASTFIGGSGLRYPPFMLCDYDIPILRQGIKLAGEGVNQVWEPLVKNELSNAADHLSHLVRQAEERGDAVLLPDSAEYISVDLSRGVAYDSNI